MEYRTRSLGITNRLHFFHNTLSILYETDRIGNTASYSFYIVVCTFVAAGKFLPRRCLAKGLGGYTDIYIYRLQASFYFFKIRKRGYK
jgi:hypothetical protein